MAIAIRAADVAAVIGVNYDRLTAFVDVTSAHRACPLNLSGLLAADDASFAHDVFGIRRHVNHRTKRLDGCFVPRYAA